MTEYLVAVEFVATGSEPLGASSEPKALITLIQSCNANESDGRTGKLNSCNRELLAVRGSNPRGGVFTMMDCPSGR